MLDEGLDIINHDGSSVATIVNLRETVSETRESRIGKYIVCFVRVDMRRVRRDYTRINYYFKLS